MWVVSKLGFASVNGQYRPDTYCNIGVDAMKYHDCCVVLKNTKTGELRSIYSQPNIERFFEQLSELRPYGYFDNGSKKRLVADNIIVVVDDYDLELLSFVESIKGIYVGEEDPMYPFVQSIRADFRPLDDDNTIFMIEGDGHPLFKIMQFNPQMWYGDKFYIYSMRTPDGFISSQMIYKYVYEVTFNDPKAARRLVTKVAFLKK